jgi:hypothetical protein
MGMATISTASAKGHFNFVRNYPQEINLGKRTRVGSTGRKAKPVTLATLPVKRGSPVPF